MRKCRPRQYHEPHEQEHGDAEQSPEEKGTLHQQSEAAAGQNERAGERNRHGEVKKEAKRCAGPATRVSVLPKEAAGH
jgi:hypothetical protein